MNTIEKLWKVIILFTAELLDVFFLPSSHTDWLINLRSFTGTLYS